MVRLRLIQNRVFFGPGTTGCMWNMTLQELRQVHEAAQTYTQTTKGKSPEAAAAAKQPGTDNDEGDLYLVNPDGHFVASYGMTVYHLSISTISTWQQKLLTVALVSILRIALFSVDPHKFCCPNDSCSAACWHICVFSVFALQVKCLLHMWVLTKTCLSQVV